MGLFRVHTNSAGVEEHTSLPEVPRDPGARGTPAVTPHIRPSAGPPQDEELGRSLGFIAADTFLRCRRSLGRGGPGGQVQRQPLHCPVRTAVSHARFS